MPVPSPSPTAPRPKREFNQTLMSLAPSAIREFFDLVTESEGIVSLGVGEPDFVTPWDVREHAIYTLERGATSYTSNLGLLELRREIAKYLEERFDLVYDPRTEILVTVGVSQGLDIAMRALLNPGDQVIYHEPCYVAYRPMIALAGGDPVSITVRYEDNFRIDLEKLESLITPRTRALLVNYPCNPTGATFSAEECRRVADIAERHDLTIVSDEVYAEMTYDQPHIAMPTQPGARERTVLLNGFSKAFAMTGWRIGFAAGPADIVAAMTKVFQFAMLSAPIMSQNAAIEALRRRHKDVPEMIEIYNQRRRVIVEGMRAIGIDCHMPEGAFYAFPCIRKFGLSSKDFCVRLLKEEKVAVVPGSGFGGEGEGFIRCAYAAGFDEIEFAIRGMERMINRL
ncbi:aminotransferase class I/II-fold pyridoxal phosphate-dependent enzyme [Candidatus Sumerlaeota bacterium]|nr:aminotransferase class I/II-fold pyridoxal phosphate-dependent enzyme [Candidatus Sumerlaeota bacterium]